MKVRTRLVVAFAYVLLTVIVALEVFLVITLRKRAEAELRTEALVRAQSLVAAIGREGMADRDRLHQTLLPKLVERIEGGTRIIVVDLQGRLVADSASDAFLGTRYATADRPELLTALEEQRPRTEIRFSEALDREIMATAVPIVDEGLVGALRVTQSTEQINANVRRIVVGLIAIGLAPLVAGLILAFVLADSLARPLSRLAATARRLGAGELDARADGIRGAREIDELARSFDEMADRLERSVRAQREFVANASHQLRTPLTGMKLRLESAAHEASTGDLRKQITAAEREVDRLSDIVARLLVMSRQIESGEAATVDLGAAADRALSRWSERGERAGATLSIRGHRAFARADPTDVDQILDNLIDNAVGYAPGPIVIETGLRDGDAFLAVEDRGPGIPSGERGRVTERFYRGKDVPVGGSGLGLAIARELAQKWGGSIRLSDGAEGGTRVEIRLAATDVPDTA